MSVSTVTCGSTYEQEHNMSAINGRGTDSLVAFVVSNFTSTKWYNKHTSVVGGIVCDVSKAVRPIELPRVTRPSTRHHIPKRFAIQPYRCENLKSCRVVRLVCLSVFRYGPTCHKFQ